MNEKSGLLKSASSTAKIVEKTGAKVNSTSVTNKPFDDKKTAPVPPAKTTNESSYQSNSGQLDKGNARVLKF